MSKAKNEYSEVPLKDRQREHTVTLRKPDGIYTVEPRHCWHEGPWLCFRVKNGDRYTVRKVPAWRVVCVSWEEEPDTVERK